METIRLQTSHRLCSRVPVTKKNHKQAPGRIPKLRFDSCGGFKKILLSMDNVLTGLRAIFVKTSLSDTM